MGRVTRLRFGAPLEAGFVVGQGAEQVTAADMGHREATDGKLGLDPSQACLVGQGHGLSGGAVAFAFLTLAGGLRRWTSSRSQVRSVSAGGTDRTSVAPCR